jgi:hypothetical protein
MQRASHTAGNVDYIGAGVGFEPSVNGEIPRTTPFLFEKKIVI